MHPIYVSSEGTDVKDGYYHVPEGYIYGQSLYMEKGKSLKECKEICDNDSECKAFEFYVDYGYEEIEDFYEVGDCQPKSTAGG